MKLYYLAGASSLAPHIVLQESGLAYELEVVDSKTRKTKSNQDFVAINAKGYVPVLELDNGDILTEVIAILIYLADQAPSKQLMPEDTFKRYQCIEWLSFIATELHKSFSPLFNASMPAQAKEFAKDKLIMGFKWVDTQLQGKQFILGEKFSVADPYLLTVAR